MFDHIFYFVAQRNIKDAVNLFFITQFVKLHLESKG